MSENIKLALCYTKDGDQLPVKSVGETPKWIIDFGRLDAGETKTKAFYVKNISNDAVEELEVNMPDVDVPNIFAEILEGKTHPMLNPGESFEVVVQWSADEDAKATQLVTGLSVTGYFYVEELTFI